MEEQNNNLWLFLEALARRRRFILIFLLIALAVTTTVVMLLPDWYNSSALLLPPAEQKQPVINVSGNEGAQGFDVSSLSTTGDVLVRILNSQNIADRMIQQFDLIKRYGKDNLQEAEEHLKDVVNIFKTDEGMINITVQDKDPKFAAVLTNGFIEQLDSLTKSVARTQAKEKVTFFEGRLKIANKQLTDARDAFRDFQTENKAIDFEEQTHLAMERAVSLKVELEQIDIELALAKKGLRPDDTDLARMKSRAEVIRDKLNQIEYGGKTKSFLSMPLSSIPDLRGKYEALSGRVKVAEAVTSVLYQQLEQSRIQEEGLVEYSVIQYARESEIPTRPNRPVLLLVAWITSLILAVLFAVLLEYFKALKSKSPQDYERAMMFARAYLAWLPGVKRKV